MNGKMYRMARNPFQTAALISAMGRTSDGCHVGTRAFRSSFNVQNTCSGPRGIAEVPVSLSDELLLIRRNGVDGKTLTDVLPVVVAAAAADVDDDDDELRRNNSSIAVNDGAGVVRLASVNDSRLNDGVVFGVKEERCFFSVPPLLSSSSL
jgi:hypothetical protein